jgi:pyruvate dehydrogenase E2 component (dihydrolipoamide acetyltransferase)
VGHSLGAAVAAFATKRLGTSVKSLFLISPAGLGPDINADFIDGFCRSRNESSLRSWMELLVADPQGMTDPLVRATATSRASGQVAATQQALADLVFVDGTQAFSIRPVLNRIAIPTRIVMGREDRIIPARHTADLPGHVALHLLHNVGHMPHIEATELVARLVKEHVE